ncbi:MAG: TonB-dependent receptor domain-containing protein [Gammaproteobacteria bacterium]
MNQNREIARAVRHALVTSALVATATSVPLQAQDQDQDEEVTTVTVTGTRINVPGISSSSPIYSVGAEEIQFQQQPEVEKILRLLPITAPDDGQNVNNGTDGAATINLRGLGPQRNLILVDGKRATPYNFDGLVDTSMIPTALIERIDIVTGGASAVYGSDAISGALNFVLRKDFEGVELNTDFSQFDEQDGDIRTVSLTLGSNVAEGRGNVVLTMNWTDREGVQLGSRPLGQLGIDTADGSGYAEFLAGLAPPAAPAGCGGPGTVAAGGTINTLPTRASIAGGPSLGQVREDRTLGADCNVFNFNPFNYYQTPQERFGGMVMGRFELNEHAEPYARFSYGSVNVAQQVAPSGLFADPLWTPVANPFISAQQRAVILSAAETGRAAGTVFQADPGDPTAFFNWRDLNGNGSVDGADDLLIAYRRRTVEFGERATSYDNNAFQLLLGQAGAIVGDWEYDVSFSYGESDRTNTNSGYTNLANLANAVDAVSTTTCRNPSAAGCVPIDLFGGAGSITDAMAAYSSATALEQQSYQQQIANASVSGPVNALQIPSAATPLAVSFGVEYREETAQTTPDECLKLAPASCLGGAGGNVLPIEGGYDVNEVFGEAVVPLVSGVPFLQSVDLELGYRYSDYSLTGTDETYKYGVNWRMAEPVLFRAMFQKAARAPNVGELAAPQTTFLDNATLDPCSVANAANIDATLRARCLSTGMLDAQVGTVEDIASGQINTFSGTDLANLPAPEAADTLTVGVVFTPDLGGAIRNAVISLDYYDIDIDDYIDEFRAQEILDACYVVGLASECAKVRRIGGGLSLPGSGLETFTTNLENIHAEGIELGFSFRVDTERFGSLAFMGNVNKYLTHERQSDSVLPVLDCLGRYGTSCEGPKPEIRWIQRTTWDYRDFQASLLWRHVGSVEREVVEKANTFPAFQQIDSYDYFDLYGGYQLFGNVTVSAGITNLLNEDPPVVGNEAADTGSNSGNTFPSTYDTLGRMYALGVNVRF